MGEQEDEVGEQGIDKEDAQCTQHQHQPEKAGEQRSDNKQRLFVLVDQIHW